MKRPSFGGYLGVVALFAIMGAGCDAPGVPSALSPAPVARTMGFGKLPHLENPVAPVDMGTGPLALNKTQIARAPAVPVMPPSAMNAPLGSPEAISARPMGMMVVPSSGGGVAVAPSRIMKPIPSPYPKPRPVTVEYVLEGVMPTWGSEGEVLQRQSNLPDKNTVVALAAGSGLPTELMRSVESIGMMSVQWKDTEKYQWTFDVSSRSISFWKEVNAILPATDLRKQPDEKPSYKKDEVIAIANAFLDRHGFSSVRAQGGEVEEAYGIMPMATGVMEKSMPCIMNGQSDGAVVSPQIYPSPCGWWSPQVTVFYGGMRDGKKVTDMWGNVYRMANVTVNLQTKEAVNGNLQLDEKVVGSSYAMIDLETAKRRLQSGGRNPIYAWGNEDGSIKVSIKNIELVWMRYDVWAEGVSEAYYLPALLATGSVQRGKSKEKEDYRTVLPLVRDDVFDDQLGMPQPVPLPAMRTNNGGGSVPAPKPVLKK